MSTIFVINEEFNTCKQTTREHRTVLMTGFEPFTDYPTNPSWSGVEHLNKEEVENKYNINLARLSIPVKYKSVNQIIPKLWNDVRPDLTIHVGVSQYPCFVLETQAKRVGYNRVTDEDGVYHNQHLFPGPEVLVTQLDVAAICRNYNRRFCRSPLDQPCKISSDAGSFLCEYIYYTSLSCGTSPTLFIHVPDHYTKEQIARGLDRILQLCLQQLADDETQTSNICAENRKTIRFIGV